MADKKKSFTELLSEAPLTTQEDTISLVGALGRSSQSGKFVLALGPGQSVTLDASAVKNYQVLGGGVGQVLVQIDVDRDKVPADVAQQAAAPFTVATPHHAAAVGANVGMTVLAADTLHTIQAVDNVHTLPLLDTATVAYLDHHTSPIVDIYHTGSFPYPD